MEKTEAAKLLQSILAQVKMTVVEHQAWAQAIQVLMAEPPKEEPKAEEKKEG